MLLLLAAALATLRRNNPELFNATSPRKRNYYFEVYLYMISIKEIRGTGLMLALIMETPAIANQVILNVKTKI